MPKLVDYTYNANYPHNNGDTKKQKNYRLYNFLTSLSSWITHITLITPTIMAIQKNKKTIEPVELSKKEKSEGIDIHKPTTSPKIPLNIL